MNLRKFLFHCFTLIHFPHSSASIPFSFLLEKTLLSISQAALNLSDLLTWGLWKTKHSFNDWRQALGSTQRTQADLQGWEGGFLKANSAKANGLGKVCRLLNLMCSKQKVFNKHQFLYLPLTAELAFITKYMYLSPTHIYNKNFFWEELYQYSNNDYFQMEGYVDAVSFFIFLFKFFNFLQYQRKIR